VRVYLSRETKIRAAILAWRSFSADGWPTGAETTGKLHHVHVIIRPQLAPRGVGRIPMRKKSGFEKRISTASGRGSSTRRIYDRVAGDRTQPQGEQEGLGFSGRLCVSRTGLNGGAPG